MKALKELIELGVDLNLQDYDKRTALHLAAAENQVKVIELLLVHNVEMKFDCKGETGFQDAIRSDSGKILGMLRSKYGKPDFSGINPQELATEQCIAVAHNDVQKLQLFIEAEMPISFCDYDGRTPLHIATSNGYAIIAKMLIDAGSNTLAKDNFGNLPELQKTNNTKIQEDSREVDVINNEALKESKVIDDTRLTEAGDSSFDFTMQTNRMLLSVLLCNLVDDGNLPKIRDILLTIDDLSIIHDYDFRTPLHIAAARDRAEIAQFLINRGAKVNALDRWRRTPLYEAVRNKNKKVAKILA